MDTLIYVVKSTLLQSNFTFECTICVIVFKIYFKYSIIK